jgi:hypothetical protein
MLTTVILILIVKVGPPVAAKGVLGVNAGITPGRDQGKLALCNNYILLIYQLSSIISVLWRVSLIVACHLGVDFN